VSTPDPVDVAQLAAKQAQADLDAARVAAAQRLRDLEATVGGMECPEWRVVSIYKNGNRGEQTFAVEEAARRHLAAQFVAAATVFERRTVTSFADGTVVTSPWKEVTE
jgi:hypothetical protein